MISFRVKTKPTKTVEEAGGGAYTTWGRVILIVANNRDTVEGELPPAAAMELSHLLAQAALAALEPSAIPGHDREFEKELRSSL